MEACADLPREKAHFPFLKLPAEIRNMIYQFALVTDHWIPISDIYPPDFEDLMELDPPLRRTTYLMNVHDACYCEELPLKPYMRTTYEYEWWCHCDGGVDGIALLSVCRQVNTEAVPIFYGMNKFNFCSMQAIVPFFQDRPLTSSSHIKRLRLFFMLEKEGAKRRHQVWTSALDYIGQKLRLETLDIMVYPFIKCSMAEIREGIPRMQWVESLILINELKTLDVEVDFAQSVDAMFSPRRMESNAIFEREFIEYLESKMLRSKATASIAQA